ncbi:hypothetical protein N7490_004047 [Penicillium lividum]|nr:hypothetical protein N7490_004047 [Penicillium lividum]
MSAPFGCALARKIATTSRFWLILLWDRFFFNSSTKSASFLLWLSEKDILSIGHPESCNSTGIFDGEPEGNKHGRVSVVASK